MTRTTRNEEQDMKKILCLLMAILTLTGCGVLPSLETAGPAAEPPASAEPVRQEAAALLRVTLLPELADVPVPTPASTPTPTPTPEPTNTPAPTPTPEPPTVPARVLADGAGAIVRTFALGERVTIADAREGYYLVETQEGQLLVERWLVRAEGTESPQSYTAYARGNTEIYPDPYLEGERLAALNANVQLTVEDAFGLLVRVVLQDGRRGYALASAVSRNRISSGSRGSSGGQDGGDIPLAAPRSEGLGVVRLGQVRSQAPDKAVPAAGVVLADGVEGYLALFQRDETVRVLAREAESCTLLVDGRTVPMASWLLSFEDQAPFEPFPAYAASKARFHDHWRLLDEGKELKVNTKLTVVGQLPRGYVVQIDGETGYMALADVSLQHVSVSSGSGSSGGDWTDPTL